MSSVNEHTVLGRLGSDPDVRFTQDNTAVATLSIATSYHYKDDQGVKQENTEWHRVVAWGRTAEIAQQYLKKGDQVYIQGPVQTRKWEDKDGQTRYTTETKALKLVLIGSGSGGNKVPHPGEQPQGSPQGNKDQKLDSDTQLGSNFDDLDDDLPF